MAPRKINTRNPRNSENNLFKQLTKLLSGPINNRRAQFYRAERRRQLDKYGLTFTSTSGKSFKKSSYNPFDYLANINQNYNRAERYAEFEQMEYTPEIASTLDIYADEMTTWNDLESMLNIECSNEEIKMILINLYQNILNIEFNLFGWCRTMCKTGDFFLYLDIDEEMGIKNVMGLPPHEVERLEGQDKTNPNYVQFQWNSAGLTFEQWQIAHFRILGNDKYTPYGTSVLEPARRIWRQLTLLEDAMMAYRITRAPERRVFKIDVGSIPPQDVEQYMQKIMTQMKRNQVIDENTGRVDLRYNPMSVEEDYFLPVRGDKSPSAIETLPGGSYTGDIDDVKYLRDKLFSALKIPMSYLSRGEGADEDKTTLAQKDIRFARTIQRLQRAVVTELTKIGTIHLYVLGYRGDDLISHTLTLNNPSKIAELQELEHWKTRSDVASSLTENFFSKRFIAKTIFGLSDEEFQRNERELFHDRKVESALDQESELLAAEAGGGGSPMGDMGLPDDGMNEPAPPEADMSEPEGGGEESDSPLLAAPAKRDDRLTTTPASKGKMYLPAKHTGGDHRMSGARKRSYLSKAAIEKASGTKRNVLGTGALELMSLGKGVYENSFNKEKSKLFERNDQIKNLVEALERKKETKTEEN